MPDLSLRMNVKFSMKDISESIASEWTYDEIIEFIDEIDKKMMDWDFTEKLSNYVNERMKEKEEEDEEDEE